ncbi:hypothetical protein KBC79_04835 [Candidatus Woesebacteria bacterium]|nr:hypothetical protein [Candidatus Woesebacteria bacterium]
MSQEQEKRTYTHEQPRQEVREEHLAQFVQQISFAHQEVLIGAQKKADRIVEGLRPKFIPRSLWNAFIGLVGKGMEAKKIKKTAATDTKK